MQKWLLKFFNAVFTNGLSAVATFVSGVLILHVLNIQDASRYTLLFSGGTFITLLGTLGQIGQITRIYSRSKKTYNWRKDYFNTAIRCAVLITAGVFLFAVFYKLTYFELVFVFFYTIFNVFSNISGGMLNSQRHYVLGGLLYRLQNSLFLIPALMMWAGWIPATLTIALIGLMMAGFLCVCLGWYSTIKLMPNGKEVISRSERKDSASLVFGGLSHACLDPGLLVVAGYFITGVEFAALGGIFTFLRPAALVWATMNQSLSVEFAREKTIKRKKIFQSILLLILFVVGIAWGILPWLINIVYQGKYNIIQPASLPIALMIGLLLSEIVSRSYIVGSAASKLLKQYGVWLIASAILFLGVEVVFLKAFGLFAVAWVGVFALLARNIIGYVYMMITKNRNEVDL